MMKRNFMKVKQEEWDAFILWAEKNYDTSKFKGFEETRRLYNIWKSENANRPNKNIDNKPKQKPKPKTPNSRKGNITFTGSGEGYLNPNSPIYDLFNKLFGYNDAPSDMPKLEFIIPFYGANIDPNTSIDSLMDFVSEQLDMFDQNKNHSNNNDDPDEYIDENSVYSEEEEEYGFFGMQKFIDSNRYLYITWDNPEEARITDESRKEIITECKRKAESYANKMYKREDREKYNKIIVNNIAYLFAEKLSKIGASEIKIKEIITR